MPRTAVSGTYCSVSLFICLARSVVNLSICYPNTHSRIFGMHAQLMLFCKIDTEDNDLDFDIYDKNR